MKLFSLFRDDFYFHGYVYDISRDVIEMVFHDGVFASRDLIFEMHVKSIDDNVFDERVHRWKQWNSLVVSSIWMTTSVCHRCRVDNLSAWKYLFVVLEGTDRENHAIDTVLETVHRYSIDCYVKF